VKQKEFGVKGPEVTIIGQGTWYVDRSDRKSAAAALRRGIELGMTHIDTAEMYGDAELVIADAIAGASATTFISSPRCCRATHLVAAPLPPASDR
jgi:diketogulonate reductase-like aldo/keto reductase